MNNCNLLSRFRRISLWFALLLRVLSTIFPSNEIMNSFSGSKILQMNSFFWKRKILLFHLRFFIPVDSNFRLSSWKNNNIALRQSFITFPRIHHGIFSLRKSSGKVKILLTKTVLVKQISDHIDKYDFIVD